MTLEKVLVIALALILVVLSPFVMPVLVVMALYAESGSQTLNLIGKLACVLYPSITIALVIRSFQIIRKK